MLFRSEFWGVRHDSDKTDFWIHGTLRPGFTLFCFTGSRDGEDIKTDFKTRLEEAEALLTEQERKDIVTEGQFIFDQCIAIVEALDAQLKTDHELVKTIAAREAKHGNAHLKMTPTRAVVSEAVDSKPPRFLRAIVVAVFAFLFYHSYQWHNRDDDAS